MLNEGIRANDIRDLLGAHFARHATLLDGECDCLGAALFHVDKEGDDECGAEAEDKEEDEGVADVACAVDDGGTYVGADERGGAVRNAKQAEEH